MIHDEKSNSEWITLRPNKLISSLPVFLIRIHRVRVRIRIQNLGWIPIQGFDDQKLQIIYSWNNFDIFLIKNCNLLISRPPYRTSKQKEKPSALKREHPALQNMNFLNFFYFVGHFCSPGSGSKSADLIECWNSSNRYPKTERILSLFISLWKMQNSSILQKFTWGRGAGEKGATGADWILFHCRSKVES